MNERTESRRIAVLVGSLRKQSLNLRLAETLGKRVPAHVEWQILPLHELPLYNQDRDADMPEPVQRLKRDRREFLGPDRQAKGIVIETAKLRAQKIKTG